MPETIMNRLVGKGRAVYGQPIGIMLMDEIFPRVPGDIGNATTFRFPVVYEILKGLGLHQEGAKIVSKTVSPKLIATLCDAAKHLEEKGVRAIVGGCGFMARFQEQLTEAVTVPVYSSSLLLVPLVARSLPSGKKKIGMIFARSTEVTDELLNAVGIDHSIPKAMAGFDWLEHSELEELWEESDPEKRVSALEEGIVKIARKLVSLNPDIGAIFFECTNMPPAARAVQEETSLPVFDVTTLVNLAYDAAVRKSFEGHL